MGFDMALLKVTLRVDEDVVQYVKALQRNKGIGVDSEAWRLLLEKGLMYDTIVESMSQVVKRNEELAALNSALVARVDGLAQKIEALVEEQASAISSRCDDIMKQSIYASVAGQLMLRNGMPRKKSDGNYIAADELEATFRSQAKAVLKKNNIADGSQGD